MISTPLRSSGTWIAHTISLAISGFIALTTIIVEQNSLLLLISITAAMGLLASILQGTIGRVASWLILYTALYIIAVMKAIRAEYVIILSVILLMVLCYMEGLATCIPSAILVSTLASLNDASMLYWLIPTLLGMISIITYYITGHQHTLILLAAVPVSLVADRTAIHMLLASIAVGLVSVYRRGDPSCPFRLERGLLSIGSFITAFAIIAYLVALNLGLTWPPSSYFLTFWVYGYLLQIAGLLTPKPKV